MEKDPTYYRYRQLLADYLLDLLDKEQVEELVAFAHRHPDVFDALLNDEAVKGLAGGLAEKRSFPRGTSRRMRQRLLAAITVQPAGNPVPAAKPRLYRWRRYVAAASILLLMGIGGWWIWHTRGPQQSRPVIATNSINVPPGHRGAILTLSDGRQVRIDSAGHGILPDQGASRILLANGAVQYAPNGPAADKDIVYNTITTPMGRQVQLVLPDGSRVWLNAGSSLHYPTAFSGRERAVELTGEGYFEVAHNAAQPFRVKVRGQVIEDIGTAFNIKAYTDEPAMTTTLAEGAVRIGATVLKPGQQALISDGGQVKVSAADIDQALAWKDGLFYFNGADLQTVLRELARWYDVKVVYEGVVPRRHFGGELSMELNLAEVLGFLKKLQVDFRMENGTLIVSAAGER